ncbi:kelch-like protein diablo [Oppia nitens]|uniref:kelch-like protein diablo n=1 Tax=Oppia nitens TaxID=1686743 RepID=UPI0023DC904D|nr:kelch-like protein diablo [Oppia nitens]
MNSKRRGLALVAHNGYMYAIGGNNGIEVFNTMERLDTTTKQWQPMANMSYTRGYFGSAIFMDKIYVCGGYNSSNEKTCETYDPLTNQWTQIASMLSDRDNFQLITFNQQLYAMGGVFGKPETVEIYDYKSNQWSYSQSLPIHAYDFGATVI